MDIYNLPSNWAKFNTNLLNGQLDTINELAAGLTDENAEFNIDTPAGDDTPSGLDVAESLAAAKTAVNAELAERTAAETEATARREAALAALTDPEPEPEPEPEAPAEPVVELAADPEPEPEPAPEPAPETPTETLADGGDEDDTAEIPVTEPIPAPEPTPVAPDAVSVLSNMNSRRTASELPQPTSEGVNGRMRAVGQQGEGAYLDDLESLSNYMSDQLTARNTSQYMSDEPQRIKLVTSQFNYAEDQMLTGADASKNFVVLDRAGRAYRDQLQANVEDEALTAAGAPCAPLMPSYEFTNCFSAQRPVEAGIAVIGAPRGGIKFLNQVALGGEAAAAISERDAAQSAILPGQPGYVGKACTRVSCPTETEVTVGSISWCVTFDNLNFRVFPEQVRDMLERVQVEYTKAKEIFYLSRIDQLANTPIDIEAAQPAVFGTGRSLFRDLVTAGHNYRKRNNMNKDAVLDVLLPDMVEESLAIDTINDPNMSAVGNIMSGPNGNLTEILARRARLNVRYYYYDAATAGFPASAHNGDATAWRPLPTTFRSYMHAPGAVVRLDGGQMDLGIVRDSTLNGQNDLQMFAEQWLEVARPGCEITALDHTVCYSGVGPLHVTAPACP